MNDSKSIFGIAVGLVALFLFWLWASGKYATVMTAIGAAPASVATGAAATTTNGQTGATAAASTGSTSGVVAVPNYVNTSPLASALAAIQNSPAYSSAMAGYTTNGATSAGVSVTPTVLANSSAVPNPTVSSSGGNWLSELLGLGSNAAVSSSVGTNDPTQLGQNGTLDPVTGLATGGV